MWLDASTNGVALLVIAGVAVAASFRAARRVLVDVRAAVLAAVFTWAAASKVVSFPNAGGARLRRSSCLRASSVPPSGRSRSGEALVPLLVVAGLPRAAAVWSGGAAGPVFSVTLVARGAA